MNQKVLIGILVVVVIALFSFGFMLMPVSEKKQVSNDIYIECSSNAECAGTYDCQGTDGTCQITGPACVTDPQMNKRYCDCVVVCN